MLRSPSSSRKLVWFSAQKEIRIASQAKQGMEKFRVLLLPVAELVVISAKKYEQLGAPTRKLLIVKVASVRGL